MMKPQFKTKAKATQNSVKNGLSQPVFFENIFSKTKNNIKIIKNK